MAILKNPRHEKFVQGLIQGMSQRKAYREAFPAASKWKDTTVDVKASKLFSDDKPEFTQYVDSLISKFTSSELSTVWKALIRRCSIGDVQAIKLYFEMRRELSSKDESGVQIIDDI